MPTSSQALKKLRIVGGRVEEQTAAQSNFLMINVVSCAQTWKPAMSTPNQQTNNPNITSANLTARDRYSTSGYGQNIEGGNFFLPAIESSNRENGRQGVPQLHISPRSKLTTPSQLLRPSTSQSSTIDLMTSKSDSFSKAGFPVDEHTISVDEHTISVDEHTISVDEHAISVDEHALLNEEHAEYSHDGNTSFSTHLLSTNNADHTLLGGNNSQIHSPEETQVITSTSDNQVTKQKPPRSTKADSSKVCYNSSEENSLRGSVSTTEYPGRKPPSALRHSTPRKTSSILSVRFSPNLNQEHVYFSPIDNFQNTDNFESMADPDASDNTLDKRVSSSLSAPLLLTVPKEKSISPSTVNSFHNNQDVMESCRQPCHTQRDKTNMDPSALIPPPPLPSFYGDLNRPIKTPNQRASTHYSASCAAGNFGGFSRYPFHACTNGWGILTINKNTRRHEWVVYDRQGYPLANRTGLRGNLLRKKKNSSQEQKHILPPSLWISPQLQYENAREQKERQRQRSAPSMLELTMKLGKGVALQGDLTVQGEALSVAANGDPPSNNIYSMIGAPGREPMVPGRHEELALKFDGISQCYRGIHGSIGGSHLVSEKVTTLPSSDCVYPFDQHQVWVSTGLNTFQGNEPCNGAYLGVDGINEETKNNTPECDSFWWKARKSEKGQGEGQSTPAKSDDNILQCIEANRNTNRPRNKNRLTGRHFTTTVVEGVAAHNETEFVGGYHPNNSPKTHSRNSNETHEECITQMNDSNDIYGDYEFLPPDHLVHALRSKDSLIHVHEEGSVEVSQDLPRATVIPRHTRRMNHANYAHDTHHDHSDKDGYSTDSELTFGDERRLTCRSEVVCNDNTSSCNVENALEEGRSQTVTVNGSVEETVEKVEIYDRTDETISSQHTSRLQQIGEVDDLETARSTDSFGNEGKLFIGNDALLQPVVPPRFSKDALRKCSVSQESLLPPIEAFSNTSLLKRFGSSAIRMRKDLPPKDPDLLCFQCNIPGCSHGEILKSLETSFPDVQFASLQYDPVHLQDYRDSIKELRFQCMWLFRLCPGYDPSSMLLRSFRLHGERMHIRRADDVYAEEQRAFALCWEMFKREKEQQMNRDNDSDSDEYETRYNESRYYKAYRGSDRKPNQSKWRRKTWGATRKNQPLRVNIATAPGIHYTAERKFLLEASLRRSYSKPWRPITPSGKTFSS